MTQPASIWNGAIPSATIVPDVATAEGIGIPQAQDGILIFVTSKNAYYQLSLASGHAIDGDVYLSTVIGGASRWIKTNIQAPGGGTTLAFEEAGAPVVTSGTLNVTGAGATMSNVGGVATLDVPGAPAPAIAFEEAGAPVVTSGTMNVTGAGATLTNVSGVATLNVPGGGGGGGVGQNFPGAGRRNAFKSTQQADPGLHFFLKDTTLIDGGAGSIAGKSIALLNNKLLVSGQLGAQDGAVMMVDVAGGALDNMLPGATSFPLQNSKAPNSMAAVMLGGNPWIEYVGVGGVSTSNGSLPTLGEQQANMFGVNPTGAEDWSTAQLAIIQNSDPVNNDLLLAFTVPTANKVYTNIASLAGTLTADPAASLAETPTCICSDFSGNVFVSYQATGTVRKFTASFDSGTGIVTLTLVATFAAITDVVAMCSDGQNLYCVSTTGAPASNKIFRVAPDGTITSVTITNPSFVPDANSQILWDGEMLWISSPSLPLVTRFDPISLSFNTQVGAGTPATFRSFTVDPEAKVVYMAALVTGSIKIYAETYDAAGIMIIENAPSIYAFSALAGPPDYATQPLNVVSLPLAAMQAAGSGPIALDVAIKSTFAFWHKRVFMDATGNVVVQDIETPILTATAVAQGWAFNLAFGAGVLTGDLTATGSLDGNFDVTIDWNLG